MSDSMQQIPAIPVPTLDNTTATGSYLSSDDVPVINPEDLTSFLCLNSCILPVKF